MRHRLDHSITSSARASSKFEMLRSNAFAAFILSPSRSALAVQPADRPALFLLKSFRPSRRLCGTDHQDWGHKTLPSGRDLMNHACVGILERAQQSLKTAPHYTARSLAIEFNEVRSTW